MRGALGVSLAALVLLAGCSGTAARVMRSTADSPASTLTSPAGRRLPMPVLVPLHPTVVDPLFTATAREGRGFSVLAPRQLPEGFVLDASESTRTANGLVAVFRRGDALLVVRESSSGMGDIGDDPDASPAPFGPFAGTLFLDSVGGEGRYGYAVVTDQRQGHYYVGASVLPRDQVLAIAASMAEVR